MSSVNQLPPPLTNEQRIINIIQNISEINRLFIQTPQLHLQHQQYNSSMLILIELLKEERRIQRQQQMDYVIEIPLFPTPATTTTGLTNEEIQQHTTSLIFDETMTEQPTCPISMESFAQQEEITSINICHHIFKTNSLMNWLRNHQNCPVCRRNILGEEAQPQPQQRDNFLRNLFRNIINTNNDSFSVNLNDESH
jgi:hypothetical protein